MPLPCCGYHLGQDPGIASIDRFEFTSTNQTVLDSLLRYSITLSNLHLILSHQWSNQNAQRVPWQMANFVILFLTSRQFLTLTIKLIPPRRLNSKFQLAWLDPAMGRSPTSNLTSACTITVRASLPGSCSFTLSAQSNPAKNPYYNCLYLSICELGFRAILSLPEQGPVL